MYAIILIIMTGIVVWVGIKSSMLRNELFNEENFCKMAEEKGTKNPRPAYSLGRSQLAFWTVIIISSFIYLFLQKLPNVVVPELNSINLGLIGIAAGTTLVSKMIDNSQKTEQNEAVPQQDHPSQDFLTDIISDEKGVSIHRLQNVIWTIVVGAIYIVYVSKSDKLPDGTVLTTELLSLMGISTAAYLGLKLNENKNAPVNEVTTNANQPEPVADVPPAPPRPETALTE